MGAIILTRMKIIVVLGAVLAVAASAAEPGCSNETRSLSACYNYVYESGSSPSAQCCTGLADVVKTRPECLCEVLNTQGINKTRAQSLPTACSVNTPSATYCHSSPPPPKSGQSIANKILNSMLLSVLTAAFCAGILLHCIH